MEATGVATSRTDAEAGVSGQMPDDSQPGTENVDRIREIIFGAQMRDYQLRFARIEERILRESADLRSETKRRLDSLEAYIRQEVDSLTERLASEKSERTASAEKMARDLGESSSALDRKLSQSEDQFSRNFRELRQLMLDQQKSLFDEFNQKTAEASSVAERRIDEVREASMPRSTLASLLTEVALRIEGQLNPPRPEGAGNGGAAQ